MSDSKHHFRKVYKSDHLGVADLEDLLEEGKKLIFTIREVKQEIGVSVAGKKGSFNIAYFNEPIKPFVLNATNAKTVKAFAGGSPFVEDWKGISVELYVDDSVKMKGETVGGVRIRPIQPNVSVPIKKEFSESNFEAASKAQATIEQIKSKYNMSPEIEAKYLEYANTEK